LKGKEIPHSLESESCLLGCMVFDNALIPKILPKLSEESFYIDSFRTIYKGIAKTYETRKAVDLVLLRDTMDPKALAAAGGVEKLTSVVDGLPNAANWEAYLATVKEKEESRRYLRACETTAQGIYAGTLSVSQARDSLRGAIFQDGRVTERASDIGVSGRTSLDSIKRCRTGGVDLGTGWAEVDDLLGGLRRKELTVFGAKMSNLKTTVALNIVAHQIANGKRVLVNAFENVDQVSTRLASMITGVPLGWFAKPHLINEEQYQRVEAAMKCLDEFKDLVMVMSSASLIEMRGVCDVFKPDLIILDYLQTYGQKFCASEDGLYARAIGKVARECQELAQDYNAHSLLLSQLARRMQGDRNRQPEINDLKESGDIENCADNALLGWWPWRDQPESGKDPHDYYVFIAKNKMGPVDKRCLRVDVETLLIKGYAA
jgi:replicative DNA helicase